MTNVKVYISLQKARAKERMEREMERRRAGGRRERKEMPCIPLSSQRKPQKNKRGGQQKTSEKFRK